jgi:hypothetical protein
VLRCLSPLAAALVFFFLLGCSLASVEMAYFSAELMGSGVRESADSCCAGSASGERECVRPCAKGTLLSEPTGRLTVGHSTCCELSRSALHGCPGAKGELVQTDSDRALGDVVA